MAAVVWFFVACGLMLGFAVYRGRALCRRLAERLPGRYEELGSPRSGFFDSARRNAYYRLLMRRGYEDLGDPDLVRAFARQRRFELGSLTILVLGFAAFAIARM